MKQLTEDYVSYEIAVLLKEKGFDENCHALYDVNTKQIDIKNVGDLFNNKQWENYISAPSQSLALKWLREMHNIHITILQVESTTITMEQEYFFYRIQKNRRMVGIFKDTFLKYEKAVEAAILYVLKNLI